MSNEPAKLQGYRRRSSSLSTDFTLPWDKFNCWVHCICVVTFDLEIGQALELVFPRHAKLTEKEKSNICYLSFPDSNSEHDPAKLVPVQRKNYERETKIEEQVWRDYMVKDRRQRIFFYIVSLIRNHTTPTMSNIFDLQLAYLVMMDWDNRCMGDTKFHFRIRCCSSGFDKKSNEILRKYNQSAPITLMIDHNFYFGFVYFRQVKDKSIARGYLQKSLVLVTKLPLANLYSHVIDTVAQEYFNSGLPGLEAACHDIDQWVEPVPGSTLNLPLLGNVIQVRLPSRFDKVSSPEVASKDLKFYTSPYVLPTVHEPNIFESLLPILSHVHLLWELVLIGDPVAVMAQSPTVCSSVVQSLVSLIWPLQYCLDYRPFFTIHDSEFKEFTSKLQAVPNVMIGVTNPFFAKTLEHWPNVVRVGGETMSSANSSPVAAQKIKRGGDLKTLDSKPGIYTRYKPFLNRDKALLKRLMKGVQAKRPTEAQSAILRRHFLELTQSFLIPLSAPQVRNFDIDEFISSLDNYGPQLTSVIKGDWSGLYKQFFHGENFIGWLKLRQAEVNYKLQLLHLEILCNAEIYESLGTKQEVELVDLFLKLREKLIFVEEHTDAISANFKTALKRHYDTVLESLREDLRSVLIKQPATNRSSIDL